jgi:hypothetical protein
LPFHKQLLPTLLPFPHIMNPNELTLVVTGTHYEMKLVRELPPSSNKDPCYHQLFLYHIISLYFPDIKHHSITIEKNEGFEGNCAFYVQLPCISMSRVPINHTVLLKQLLQDRHKEVVENFPVCSQHGSLMGYLLKNLAAWTEGEIVEPGFTVEPAPTSDV